MTKLRVNVEGALMNFSWQVLRQFVLENPGWVLAAIIVPAVIVFEVHISSSLREARIEYTITTDQKIAGNFRGMSIFFDPPTGIYKRSGGGTDISVNNKPMNTGVFRYTNSISSRKSFWIHLYGPFKLKLRYYLADYYCGEYMIDVKDDKEVEKEIEFCQGVRFN
jgi:hypothetical protein